MVSIFTTDGRQLQFAREALVPLLGYWMETRIHARPIPAEDIRRGNWIVVQDATKIDLAQVESVKM